MTQVFVGSYAATGGPGLLPLIVDAATGAWTPGTPIAAVRNASFAVASGRHGHRYVVDEAAGKVAVHDRAWRLLAEVSSGGEAPCHLALSADECRLAVANYESGSVTQFMLDERGLPGPATVRQHRGRGLDPDRQAGPHAHWVGYRGDDLLAIDLGTDRIVAHPLSGADAPRTAYAAPPGSGPRHLAFHPRLPLAYLVSELASTLTVLRVVGAAFRAEAILSILPDGATGDSLGGAIALDADARLLHVTNRGHDSVATFALDANGAPRLLGHVASGGRSPRFLLPLAEHLLVAHEEAGGVAILRRAAAGRSLPGPMTIDVPGAAFLMEE